MPSSSPAGTCARPPTGWAGRPRQTLEGHVGDAFAGMASGSGEPTRSIRAPDTASSRASAWGWTSSPASTGTRRSSWPRPSGSTAITSCPGLRRHRGPILTVANWGGDVAGARRDAQHQRVAHQDGPAVQHDLGRGPDRRLRRRGHRALDRDRDDRPRHAPRPRPRAGRPARRRRDVGRRLAGELADRMAILGVFDEGCMGMYNAIIDDEHLNPMGIYKERLSQSALRRRDAPGHGTRGPRRDGLADRARA